MAPNFELYMKIVFLLKNLAALLIKGTIRSFYAGGFFLFKSLNWMSWLKQFGKNNILFAWNDCSTGANFDSFVNSFCFVSITRFVHRETQKQGVECRSTIFVKQKRKMRRFLQFFKLG